MNYRLTHSNVLVPGPDHRWVLRQLHHLRPDYLTGSGIPLNYPGTYQLRLGKEVFNSIFAHFLV